MDSGLDASHRPGMTGGAEGANICATAQIQGIPPVPDACKRWN